MDHPVMVVTGGSRGIGAAVARLAGRSGHAVAVLFRRDAGAADRVVREVRAAGPPAVAIQVDVSQEEQVVRAFEAVDAELGPVRALVNNAGILRGGKRVDELDQPRLQQIMAVNVIGAFLCAREAVRRMSSARGGPGGAIVNVSSVAARSGSPGEYVDYAASKGAIDTFTIGLAHEVAAEGIRVNAVRPGFIETDIHRSGGDPDRLRRLAPTLPLRRAGHPEEVAEAVLWLLSEQASYVTGSFLDLAGGR